MGRRLARRFPPGRRLVRARPAGARGIPAHRPLDADQYHREPAQLPASRGHRRYRDRVGAEMWGRPSPGAHRRGASQAELNAGRVRGKLFGWMYEHSKRTKAVIKTTEAMHYRRYLAQRRKAEAARTESATSGENPAQPHGRHQQRARFRLRLSHRRDLSQRLSCPSPRATCAAARWWTSIATPRCSACCATAPA